MMIQTNVLAVSLLLAAIAAAHALLIWVAP
jgi:hypothetical protein